MKRFYKLTLMLVATLTLGLYSCSNDNDSLPSNGEQGNQTHVKLEIGLPQTYLTKASDTKTWKGDDVIKQVDVFFVNETEKTVLKKTVTNISLENNKISVVTKANAGDDVKAYVIVNSNDKTDISIDGVPAPKFADRFKSEIEAIASDLVAKEENASTITMTNAGEPIALKVEGGVTEEQAKAGKNTIKIQVERLVSRGILTLGNDAKKDIPVKNANEQESASVKINKVTYAVGQSNKKVFGIRKDGDITPEPVYSFLPENKEVYINGREKIFDYSELKAFSEVGASNTVIEALTKEQKAKFILPVTHADGKYVKGNSTYFEVRVDFTANGTLTDTKVEHKAGETIYLGKNDGKFYNTLEDAKAMGGAKGEENQKVITYENGQMVYVLWLNPDIIPGGKNVMTKTPTVRNQIYHAHITGFKEMGIPYNPLNPDNKDKDDTENPIDPTDPIENQETYMNVEISVLEWGLHSYEIEVGNDY